MKKLFSQVLAVSACAIIALHLVACTPTKSEDEASSDAAGLENPDGSAAAKPAGDEAQANFLDDPQPEDGLGKPQDKAAVPDGQASATPPPTADPLAPPPADPNAAPPPPADLMADKSATPPPATDAGATPIAPDAMAATPPPDAGAAVAPVEAAAKPAPAPLQKVKEAPFQGKTALMNAVYIARPGDTMKSISAMIFGSPDKVKELKAQNGVGNKPRPGQKIYYNSPLRPEDSTKLLNFYEDTGVPAQTYVAKDGDKLKAVSKQLLGFPDAWKEVWETNSVESKSKLAAGTEIRYWRGVDAAPGNLANNGADPAAMGSVNANTPPPNMPAMNTPPPPPPPTMANNMPPPPPPQNMQKNMPPPPPNMQANNAPPPPPEPQAAMPPPPPPPPAAEMTPPPPPPPAPPKDVAAAPKKQPGKPTMAPPDDGMDQDTIMYMAAGGIVALGAAGYLIMKRKKAQAAATTNFETQVGA